MSKKVKVHVEICRDGVILPVYARQGDAGMDISAAEEVHIEPGQTVVVPTGLKLAIPEGYEIQVRPRSGISLKTPIRVSNTPGTIDSGYRDELGILLTNTSCPSVENNGLFSIESKGNKNGTYRIKKGDRIAQIVLQEVPVIDFELVESVADIGTNRGGGLGSTGTNKL
jgi:dUTP pyrophosphatase